MPFYDSSWTPLHSQLHRTIRQRQLFKRNQSILIAVSGGQDSLCLSKLLIDLQSKWGWKLGIVHCDHRWRVDSTANALHVEKLSKNWGVPFYLETATEPVETEAKAREWRYQTLYRIAHQNDYEYITTGHTASDRAETLLYNLMRGTGADGLQALTWKRVSHYQSHYQQEYNQQRDEIEKEKEKEKDILLIRPLLEITRTQTGQFCQDWGLPVWEDETNQDVKYARNRVRQELLPYLQQHFNPQVESALSQTAEILQAEVEYLEQTAIILCKQVIETDISHQQLFLPLQIKRQPLQKVHVAMQRRVMRMILQKAMISPINFEHIEKLTALIAAPNRTRTDPFPGGAIAIVEDNLICLI